MSQHLPPETERKILFLFSDTGGGHRSATEAIIEALALEFPGRYKTRMIDFFKEYFPPPLNYAPDVYPPISRLPEVWGFYYHLSDGRRRTRAVNEVFYPYIRQATRRMVQENPSDLIVSVHPLANTPVLRSLKNSGHPFATVVTDMVSTHAFWYDRRADLVIVPTEKAKERALCFGIEEQKIKVVGLPVAEQFNHLPQDQVALRKELDWPIDKPVILLVGGGEGMGPLERVAHAIDNAHFQASLAVVCGRNQAINARLRQYHWQMPVKIYGFVNNMAELMAAADILVTKAGPGTISEALIAGLPLVMFSHMPGQEEGNIFYVVDQKAGIWAPYPERVVAAVRQWLEHPEERQRAAEACLQIARPQAAREIARLLVGLIPEKHPAPSRQ